MKPTEVLLIFDIGKTNKKVLLFDSKLRLVHEEESSFAEAVDDDGFPCDDAHLLETWIHKKLYHYLNSESYEVKGLNFTSYGASLVYLDKQGKRMTPIYNYLKPLPARVTEGFYDTYGGLEEFSRKTASPELGMLNSGLQMLWLKRMKPEVFGRIHRTLHLPQYLSFLVHGQVVSEHTSIGCHTMMWDFDSMNYHPWLKDEGISLPGPVPVSESFPVTLEGNRVEAGIGIHDSSASLVPYIMTAKEPFILISTGTWCISMNPFNHETLSAEELSKDCLCFLGIHGKPVKSSRFFLGRIHDLNVKRLQAHFKRNNSAYKQVNPGFDRISEIWGMGEKGKLFFRNGIPEGWVDTSADLNQFASFEEAYTCLMVDLSRFAVHSVALIIAEEDRTKQVYITGGFARNPIFCAVLSLAFPGKHIFTSEVDNASSLGAGLVFCEKIWKGSSTRLDLGLTSPAPPHQHP